MPTCWSSRACCSPPAASDDRFGRKARSPSASWSSGSARSCRPSPARASTLIATRALMGIGGALIMPATLSILTNVFPTDERGTRDRHLGRACPAWASRSARSSADGCSSTSGGARCSWSTSRRDRRADRRSLVRARTRRTRRRSALDPVGAVLSIVGLVSAGVRDHRGAGARVDLDADPGDARVRRASCSWRSWSGSSAPTTRCSTSASSRTLGSPPRHRRSTLVFFALFGSLFFLTQYLQFVLGYSPLQAGDPDRADRAGR